MAIRPDPTELMRALGHAFGDEGLLAAALTHPSASGGRKKPAQEARARDAKTYERLEFLGDRVLSLLVAEWLYADYPDAREGELAKRHAALVSRDSLAAVAQNLQLGKYLRLSPGEKASGGEAKATILADALEAMLGAVYLDGGLKAAKSVVRALFARKVQQEDAPLDPKSSLQEWAQGRGLPVPVYKVLAQSGPAHALVFEVEVSVKGKPVIKAEGKSKRLAEKKAAGLLLDQLMKDAAKDG